MQLLVLGGCDVCIFSSLITSKRRALDQNVSSARKKYKKPPAPPKGCLLEAFEYINRTIKPPMGGAGSFVVCFFCWGDVFAKRFEKNLHHLRPQISFPIPANRSSCWLALKSPGAQPKVPTARNTRKNVSKKPPEFFLGAANPQENTSPLSGRSKNNRPINQEWRK